MKFVMTQSICPEGIEKLKADTNGQVEIIAEDNPDPNNYLDDMKDADALIVRIAKCDAHAIENSPNLKVIGRTGVGYDSVDVKKATELGIPVVITPGANNRSVAEHAVAMMFALSKNLYEGQVETKKGNWEIRGAHKVINCSRGGIVNEADLCAALRAGTIAGAGTDVFCNEPPKPDDPLLNTPNLIVSPHSAAQTREAVIKMANMCVDGCLAVIRGEKWPFVADKKVYDHPKWADK